MIRFAWLQFRMQAAVAFGALAVLAVVVGDHRPAPRPPLRHDRCDVRGAQQLLLGDDHVPRQ